MDPQNQQSGEVVTIKEAIEKVKNWLAEKDYEKAKQGCNEILEVEPDNPEIKGLLAKINAAERGEVAPAPAPESPATPEKIAEVVAAPTPEVTPVEEQPPSVPLVEAAPEAAGQPMQESVPETLKTVEAETAPEPADIFKKPEEIKPGHVQSAEIEEKPKSKGMVGKIIILLLLLAIIGGLAYAYLQGWLNPIFEQILNLLGL